MSKRTVVSASPSGVLGDHEDFSLILEKKEDVLADLAQYAGAFSMPVHEAKATFLALAERAKGQLGK